MKASITVQDSVITINYNNFINVTLNTNEMQDFLEQASELGALMGQPIPAEAKAMLATIVTIYNKILKNAQGTFEVFLDTETGDFTVECVSTMRGNINDIKELSSTIKAMQNYHEPEAVDSTYDSMVEFERNFNN